MKAEFQWFNGKPVMEGQSVKLTSREGTFAFGMIGKITAINPQSEWPITVSFTKISWGSYFLSELEFVPTEPVVEGLAARAKNACEAILGSHMVEALMVTGCMALPDIAKTAAVKAFMDDDGIRQKSTTRQDLRAYLKELREKGAA